MRPVSRTSGGGWAAPGHCAQRAGTITVGVGADVV